MQGRTGNDRRGGVDVVVKEEVARTLCELVLSQSVAPPPPLSGLERSVGDAISDGAPAAVVLRQFHITAPKLAFICLRLLHAR